MSTLQELVNATIKRYQKAYNNMRPISGQVLVTGKVTNTELSNIDLGNIQTSPGDKLIPTQTGFIIVTKDFKIEVK
jgi:hypothetical protein